jgi:hypothetical protein
MLMTPDQRFAVLMVLLSAAMAAIGFLAKAFFSVSRQWVRTGAKIEELTTDIRDLVASKERDHARIDTRMDRLEGRVERHEVWHSDH